MCGPFQPVLVTKCLVHLSQELNLPLPSAVESGTEDLPDAYRQARRLGDDAFPATLRICRGALVPIRTAKIHTRFREKVLRRVWDSPPPHDYVIRGDQPAITMVPVPCFSAIREEI